MSSALAGKGSSEEDPQGRREHPRLALEIAVDLQSDHNFYTGLTRNISAGGLFIATNRLRKIGDRIRVKLTLPGAKVPIEVDTEVRWVKDSAVSRLSEEGQGLGLRFVDLPADSAQVISAFLAKRDSLFYDDE